MSENTRELVLALALRAMREAIGGNHIPVHTVRMTLNLRYKFYSERAPARMRLEL
jgi:hypothetical protein